MGRACEAWSPFDREVRRYRFSIMVLFATMLGLTLSLATALAAEAATVTATTTNPPAMQLRAVSKVKGVKFALLDKLPPAPASAKVREGACLNFVADPISPAGKLVEAASWAVTSELTLGPYEAVAFAGAMEPSTSGTCAITQANVGVFDKDKLLAVAYADHLTDVTIGQIMPLEGGAVRIWSGDLIWWQVGDIQLLDNGHVLRLGALAAQEKLCHGQSIVPNIYGMPINHARTVLAKGGWKPVPHHFSPDESYEVGALELQKRGFPEVSNCSGTGVNYCSFDYKGAGGLLEVWTAGDEEPPPSVAVYAVQCHLPDAAGAQLRGAWTGANLDP
jgi:hypothetical protein